MKVLSDIEAVEKASIGLDFSDRLKSCLFCVTVARPFFEWKCKNYGPNAHLTVFDAATKELEKKINIEGYTIENPKEILKASDKIVPDEDNLCDNTTLLSLESALISFSAVNFLISRVDTFYKELINEYIGLIYKAAFMSAHNVENGHSSKEIFDGNWASKEINEFFGETVKHLKSPGEIDTNAKELHLIKIKKFLKLIVKKNPKLM